MCKNTKKEGVTPELHEKEEKTETGAELQTEVVSSDDGGNSRENEKRKEEFKKGFKAYGDCGDAFVELADLLNVTIEQVKDECCLFQIRKLMSKIGKVIVRYDVPDSELERVMYNAGELKIGEILVSPAYIPSLTRHAKKYGLTDKKICALIDFPFGESLFKSKLTSVREAIKAGVDGTVVMMPAMLLHGNNVKVFKKEVKKLGRIKRAHAGVALSVMDVTDEELKTAFKIIDKTAVENVTLVFGSVSEEELRVKMNAVNALRGKKPVRIIANVETVDAVQKLTALSVDGILTPFADELGKKLVEKFKVKSVTLK